MASRKNFVEEPPSEETKAQFRNTWAWSIFSDPSYRPFNREERMPNTTAETFTSETLATPSTIAAWQNFYRPRGNGSDSLEITSVMLLGSGVNGHIDTCHGGFVSLLLDEGTGTAADRARPDGTSTMTAFLNVTYKRPVPTPGVVVVKSWVDKVEGRKLWTKGEIVGSEGTVLALAEALFIIVPPFIPKRSKL